MNNCCSGAIDEDENCKEATQHCSRALHVNYNHFNHYSISKTASDQFNE